ncbi:MAG: hypothetical protein SAK29_10500, partial [Scytonema sp. PMC 1069.18]|nr:hypothetical protein [Scytonema sp. PMC 1069.18]
MQKILIRKPFIMVFAFSLISYIVTLLLALFFQPARLANVFGYLALLAYIATLLPSILKTVFPNTKGSKILIFLIKNRRFIGITAFILASHHGLL